MNWTFYSDMCLINLQCISFLSASWNTAIFTKNAWKSKLMKIFCKTLSIVLYLSYLVSSERRKNQLLRNVKIFFLSFLQDPSLKAQRWTKISRCLELFFFDVTFLTSNPRFSEMSRNFLRCSVVYFRCYLRCFINQQNIQVHWVN